MRRAFCAVLTARPEASMWSEWLYTYMYSVCIRGPAPGYAPGFAPVFGGRPERDYIADIRTNQRKNVAGDTPRTRQQDP